MSAFEPSLRTSSATMHAAIAVPVFAGAMFVSAVLMFSVQPMFAKMVLPLLGGSPSVWSVAMVFFQAVLLAGYGYAHLIVRRLSPRAAITLHLLVLSLAFAALPVALAADTGAPPERGAEFWLVGLFLSAVGLPFFAVSATAPLLQAWFARGLHARAADPYFLYGASNLGSFAALIAYPLVFEPWLTLRAQTATWSAGFVLLMAMIAAAGILTMAWGNAGVAPARPASRSATVAWRDRLSWVALAFVPSALLIAVTSHISTDIAAAPFLWVVPLALFLATFILTFRAGGERLGAWMLRLQPLVVAGLAVGLMRGERAFWLVAILLDLAMLFTAAMVCHRALYLKRPHTGELTSFYMWVSFGGVLGGVASGLLAPRLFPDVWEYPILIVLALAARPGVFDPGLREWLKDAGLPVALALAAAIAGPMLGLRLPASTDIAFSVALVMLAAMVMLSAANGARMIGLTVLLLVASAALPVGVTATETARSFFGVHKVVESADGRFRLLYHGTTLHGAMRLRDDRGAAVSGPPEPLTYYHFGGALGDAIAAARQTHGGRLKEVAIVGLGVGSLACHMRAEEGLTYYEIDPEVTRIARDASKFRFLSECAPDASVVLGDARLTLAGETRRFDLIVLDAFSSDVIPVHLLTREAMAMYLDRLAPGGVIALHISNRYLELASVTRDVASSLGLATFLKRDLVAPSARGDMRASALVAAVARSASDLAPFGAREGWTEAPRASTGRAWTDDYSNIPGAIWRMIAGR